MRRKTLSRILEIAGVRWRAQQIMSLYIQTYYVTNVRFSHRNEPISSRVQSSIFMSTLSLRKCHTRSSQSNTHSNLHAMQILRKLSPNAHSPTRDGLDEIVPFETGPRAIVSISPPT